jgi:hypothetical protein
MKLIPDNISIEEMQKQFETLKNLTGEQRFEITCQLSDMKRQRIIGDIKKEHPDFTEKQVKIEVIRRCYGDDLAQKVAASKGWNQ